MSTENNEFMPVPKVNADLIRTMSIDQLTEFMLSFDDKPCPPTSHDHCENMCCVECWSRWLSLPLVNGTYNDDIYYFEHNKETQEYENIDPEKYANWLALRQEFEKDEDYDQDEHIRLVYDDNNTSLIDYLRKEN